MASGNMKDIKRRIKSVQSTMQITKAMELVASSKMRHAKERALGARPYFNALYQTNANWLWSWAKMPGMCPPGRQKTMCSATPS